MTTTTFIKKRNKSEKQVQKEKASKHDILSTKWISLEGWMESSIISEPILYGKPLPEYENNRTVSVELQEKVTTILKSYPSQSTNLQMYQDGMTIDEISSTTGQDRGNVNRSINRAIAKLQKKLTEAEFYAVMCLYGLQATKTNERIDKYNQFTKELKNNMTPTEYEYENEKQHQQWFTPYEKVTIKQGDGRTDAYFHELQKTVDVFPKGDRVAEKHLRFGSPNIEAPVKDLPTPRTFSVNDL